jgi:hypothetical protein
MSVAAPVRTMTPGHSISGADPPAAWASPLAFDDVLKRSRAELLKRLLELEPQPASASERLSIAAITPATCMIYPFPSAFLFARSDNRFIVAVNRHRL